MTTLTDLPAWKALQHDYDVSAQTHMRDQFLNDPQRFERYSLEAAGLFLDYSKNRINDEIFDHLIQLAEESSLSHLREGMFSGEKINFTEQRAVLHTALRQHASGSPCIVDDEDVMPFITNELSRMGEFVDQLHAGLIKGITDKPITDIVNIGIGGSHLGPMLVCEALADHKKTQARVHFVSGTDLTKRLEQLNPETTLFIVASKTFTTQETLLNANAARRWIIEKLGSEKAVSAHFAALSTNLDATQAFGIADERVFAFRDWVGGRYSLWSAVGLIIMLLIGKDGFSELLAGANEMDTHFRSTPFAENMPVIMGLLGIWYSHFFDAHSQAVIPYEEGLHSFPAHLQQLDMESNGKSISKHGHAVSYETGPIIFGSTGTDCQHAYFQSIHQGTRLIPVDFIAVMDQPSEDPEFHRMLMSHCFAQSEALMRGKTEEEVVAELKAMGKSAGEILLLTPHRIFAGNKPSNTLLLDRLTPRSLGALIALYEHKVFVQGAIWEINSFDQWGVELGKQLAKEIDKDFNAEDNADPATRHDASTSGLIKKFREVKQ